MTLILLIITTILSFFAAQSATLSTWIAKWLNRPTSGQKLLLQERQDLKEEQQQYSMVDHFAKYSKLQRKINAIDEKLKESKNDKNSVIVNLVSNYALQTVCTLALLVLTIYYRRTPLFKLPNYIDLTPFNYIISYPNEKNYVSFHFWVMSCNAFARSFKVF